MSVNPAWRGSNGTEARVLHLSDLHTPAAVSSGQREIVEAALADIRQLNAERHFDLVVFSGDLAFDGTPAALAAGRELLLEPLRKMLTGAPIVLVPGNHDVNRARIDEFVEIGLRHKLADADAVQASLADPRGAAHAVARLSDWSDSHTQWYGRQLPDTLGLLGHVHRLEVGELRVAVAALNTAWRSSENDDRHNLLVGEDQIAAALAALADADVRLVVMHHPLDWLAPFDEARVRSALEGNGIFVLSGHDHSVNPTVEISNRGAALYSRAGCLYTDTRYADTNSYTVLDLERGSNVVVSVRAWWPTRRAFDQATDWHEGGRIVMPWPAPEDALPAHRFSLSEALRPLAKVAREHSVVADQVPEVQGETVGDLVIEPRMWPVPHHEAFDATVSAKRRPKQLDPLELFDDDTRAVLVSGPASSGVTMALLWLLERHFRAKGTHLPEYVQMDRRFSVGRLEQALDHAAARFSHGRTVLTTPVILAVDDVDVEDRRAKVRLLRFVETHPDVILVIGCHDEAHSEIADVLRTQGINPRRAFLGPFAHTQVRELVRRTGDDADEKAIAKRVLRTASRQGLPRTPLNLAALVVVMVPEEDFATLNESGLLQSYVTRLLDNPVGVDPEGLQMDYRRREHLLERLARRLVEENVTRLPRGRMEKIILDYFEEIGWHSGSAGQLVQSLIGRRVLSETDRGVGFRYPPLLHLFAGKSMLDDAHFAGQILTRPIYYRAIIRHAAGLRRNDRELLARVMEITRVAVAKGTRAAAADGTRDISPADFDKLEDPDNWAQVTGHQEVARLLPEPPSQAEVDLAYDKAAEDLGDGAEIELFHDRPHGPVDDIGPAVSLLAAVLQGSELVGDVELKAEVLREVICGWTVLTVMGAVREDKSRQLRGTFERLFDDIEDLNERQSRADHLARVFIVTLMSISLYLDVGSIHLRTVLERVLDDDAFMASSGPALFATMIYSALGFDRNKARLDALFECHGTHPMVREVVKRWALRQYHNEKDARPDQQLEDLLVDIFAPTLAEGGRYAVARRAKQQSQVRESLRQSRTRLRARRAAGEDVGASASEFWDALARGDEPDDDDQVA